DFAGRGYWFGRSACLFGGNRYLFGGNRWPLDGLVRPVAFPARALLDPLAQGLDLGGLEGIAGIARRHPQVVVGRGQPREELAAGDVAGHDGRVAGLEDLGGVFFQIEPQPGLTLAFIGTVTSVATLRQDRTDVAVVVDRGRGIGGWRRGRIGCL